MVCEVQYGGRVTDDLDRELFIAFGDDYLKIIYSKINMFFSPLKPKEVGAHFVRNLPIRSQRIKIVISSNIENISTQSLQLIHLKFSDSIQMLIEPLEKMKASI